MKSLEKFKIYKNVFDGFTLRTLFKLSTEGHFDELLSPLMIGKESNVFLASSHHDEDDVVIVKIYRLHSCNFNKMYSYIKTDPRFQEIKNQKRQVIFKWVQREYRNLLIAREKISVPNVIAFMNNVLVMESIGNREDILSADLGDVISGEADPIYLDVELFVDTTFFTEGLTRLLKSVQEKIISGKGNSVIRLQTYLGGGKTHSLIALYHYLNSGGIIFH